MWGQPSWLPALGTGRHKAYPYIDMKIYKTTKTVLSLQDNPASFLNGLTANTLDQPQNAFVNIHGRIIATFDQLKISDEEFWIAVEDPYVEALLAHLKRYQKLSGIRIEKQNQNVYFDLDGDARVEQEDWMIPQKKGRLILTKREFSVNVTEEEFRLFRLKNNIPWQGMDYTDDFLLNVSEKDFVSFTKGCFLGQEPISKVHNRSRPAWQLVVKSEEQCDGEEKAKMTSQTFDPETKKTLGFVFVRNERNV